MDLAKMSAQDLFKSATQANEVNKKLGVKSAEEKGFLGKDAFLKLLVTELRHQDPTKPMEDREFISQMAQFSSLEQMTNINKEISSLLQSSRTSEAFSLLGRRIDAFNPATGERISGTVSSIEMRNSDPVLKVGSREVAISSVHAVYDREENNNNETTQDTVLNTIDIQK